MKYRTGFVTNSSSSSYIIAYKNIIIDDETKEKYPFVKFIPKIVEMLMVCGNQSRWSDDTQPGFIIKNKKDLCEYLREEESISIEEGESIDEYIKKLNKDNWEKERCEKLLNLLKKEKFIIIKQINYHDETAQNIINILEEYGLIKVLSKEEC